MWKPTGGGIRKPEHQSGEVNWPTAGEGSQAASPAQIRRDGSPTGYERLPSGLDCHFSGIAWAIKWILYVVLACLVLYYLLVSIIGALILLN